MSKETTLEKLHALEGYTSVVPKEIDPSIPESVNICFKNINETVKEIIKEIKNGK